jgi:hypothetical protein
VTGFRSPKTGQQTIRPDAKLLFVAGAGWTKKQPDGQVHVEEAGELILKFLAVSGASLGSSKSLVDQGGEGNSVLPFLRISIKSDRPGRRRATRKGSLPAATAKSRTSWAGGSSASGEPFRSIRIADGRAARPTWFTWPMRSR